MTWKAVVLGALCAASGPAAVAAADDLPEARPLFTIASDDCVSVHADGEPWDECGFQATAMNEAGTRLLTVTTTGRIQLWDGEGREMRRVEWSDQPSGASGYPSARAVIAGPHGVAVNHQNQVVVLDLDSGAILAQRVASEIMSFEALRQAGADRVFATVKDREWRGGLAELVLPAGELRPVPELADLNRVGPGYWVSGTRAPFTVHRTAVTPAELPSTRPCSPLDERYCIWWQRPLDEIHVLDVPGGTWRSFHLGRPLGDQARVEVVRSGAAFFAVLCEPGQKPWGPRRCEVRDLSRNKVVYRFEADSVRAFGAGGEDPPPHVRLDIAHGGKHESRSVALDGKVELIDPTGATGLFAPGGGMLAPLSADASVLVDAHGRKVARLPFAAQSCGTGWPIQTAGCLTSADRRRWLVATAEPGSDSKWHWTLYEVPGVAP